MNYDSLWQQLRLEGRADSQIDTFVGEVQKLLAPFLSNADYMLFWAGEDIADEAVRIIVSGVKTAYPEHDGRIGTNPYMEPDVVLVVDMVAAGKEMIGEQV